MSVAERESFFGFFLGVYKISRLVAATKVSWTLERPGPSTILSITLPSFLGPLLRPRFHSGDERLTLALPEVLVRIVQVDTNPFVLIVLIANLTAGDGRLDALLVRTETRATPTHLFEQLMTFIALVDANFLRNFAVRGTAESNARQS